MWHAAVQVADSSSVASSVLDAFLVLGHLQSLFNVPDEMTLTTQAYDAAADHEAPYGVVLATGHAREEDADTTVTIATHNLFQDLGSGAVNRRDAMNIEDDVAVGVLATDTR